MTTQSTRASITTALDKEMTERLGYGKHESAVKDEETFTPPLVWAGQ
ncbi:hypothetical protein [Arthrobacter sp. H14-L1]|nr:hypothetical protein [Arthrobacter sp. H14-L1]MCY0903599.1 hypothetical protein [Arthrobacter sp. H14-L1]